MGVPVSEVAQETVVGEQPVPEQGAAVHDEPHPDQPGLHDQDHAEAAAFTEALERDPYRPRRRAIVRTQPAGLEQLAGIAALARALA